MQHSRYFAPYFGIVTALSLILGIVAIAAVWDIDLALQSSLDFRTVAHLTGIGLFYGMVGWACWMTSGARSLGLRSILLAAIAVAATYIELRHSGVDRWDVQFFLRYALNFGGLMVSQCAIFWLLAIPNWQWGRSVKPPDARRRFSIGGLLILTSCVALLLAFGIRYATPGNAAIYWPWFLGVCFVIPLTSAGSVAGLLHRKTSRRVLAATAALLLAAAGSVAIGMADQRQQAGGDWRLWAACYGTILTGSMCAMAFLSLAGRIDQSAQPNTVSNEPDS